MTNTVPPKYVRHILVTLQSRGYQAFLVGGCVRDMIMGIRPNDWDISTSALPEEVMQVFPGSVPTGLKHGTVTVKVNSRSAEVTTFRSDGIYSDHRHPDLVSFVGDLTTDLSRRDFTMNAIALSPDGLMADPFGGAADIENRLIRAVGIPGQRFEEDALRMFRAIRFSARLGFEIEKETYDAIKDCARSASSLAPERVLAELDKILLSPAPEKIFRLMGIGLADRYIKTRPLYVKEEDRLKLLPRKSIYRWSCLCALLEKYGCISSAEEFLSELRLDKRGISCCRDVQEILKAPYPENPAQWKKLLNIYGVDTVSCAAACGDIIYGGSRCGRDLKAVLKAGECFSLKNLAVSGEDLLELGFRGRELGEMLQFLLDYVMEFPENNKRDLLLSLAKGTEE